MGALEEQLETEEVVKGSREEYERGLGDNGEQGEVIERRATEDDDENPDDDTKTRGLLPVEGLGDDKPGTKTGPDGRKEKATVPTLSNRP